MTQVCCVRAEWRECRPLCCISRGANVITRRHQRFMLVMLVRKGRRVLSSIRTCVCHRNEALNVHHVTIVAFRAQPLGWLPRKPWRLHGILGSHAWWRRCALLRTLSRPRSLGRLLFRTIPICLAFPLWHGTESITSLTSPFAALGIGVDASNAQCLASAATRQLPSAFELFASRELTAR